MIYHNNKTSSGSCCCRFILNRLNFTSNILFNQSERILFKRFLLIKPKRLCRHTNSIAFRVFKLKLGLLFGLFTTTVLTTTAHAALSATTAQTIEGTRPYLSVARVTDINAGNDFNLFGAKFDTNSYFTVADINTKLMNAGIGSESPISLSKKLGTGTGAMTVAYKKPESPTDAYDSDGDDFTDTSLTGNATIGWYYENSLGAEVKLTSVQMKSTFCKLASSSYSNPIIPYLKINGPVTLKTQYGVPNSQVYDIDNPDSPISGGANNPIRRFYPKSGGPIMCYAKPNIFNGGGDSSWVEYEGFKNQSTTSGSGHLNFPTTGFHGASFYLTFAGVDLSTLTFSSITQGSIKVVLSVENNTTLKVLLEGPSSGQNGGAGPIAFSAPGEINITDSANTISYRFNVKKWFIPKPDAQTYDGDVSNPSVPQYCASIPGYRVPLRADYTNSPYADAVAYPSGAGGWTYPGTGNEYKRAINGGLFAEWGITEAHTGSYPLSDWDPSSSYGGWASEAYNSTLQYVVFPDIGDVAYRGRNIDDGTAVCVSP